MTRTPTWKLVAMIAAAALVAGTLVGWHAGRVNADGELRSLALAYKLQAANLCAGGLKLEQARHFDRLVTLLEQSLDDAVVDATRLVDEGAQLGPATPNLKDSARRAAEHYGAINDGAKKQKAEALLARLNGQQ